MGNYIVIGSIVAPAVLLLVLRSNAALTFLSLCVGSVLSQVAASDATTILGSFVAGGNGADYHTVALGLLLGPAILTAIVMAKSVHKRQLVLQLLPALGVGVASLVLAKSWLSPNLQRAIEQASLWPTIDAMQVGIVGLTALLCLLVIWLQRPKHFDDKHAEH